MPRTFNGAVVEMQTQEWEQLAFALAFFTGLLLLVGGFLRLGFLVNFVSEPVIVGFTTAAAIVIAFSQVRSVRVREHSFDCLSH